MLSDDGPKMKKKTKKNNFNAGLDKVGFIEAQGLPWVFNFIF